MSSAQDPFYIVKEEIQDSVSLNYFLFFHYRGNEVYREFNWFLQFILTEQGHLALSIYITQSICKSLIIKRYEDM